MTNRKNNRKGIATKVNGIPVNSETAKPETATPETATPETATPETATPETATNKERGFNVFEVFISFVITRICRVIKFSDFVGIDVIALDGRGKHWTLFKTIDAIGYNLERWGKKSDTKTIESNRALPYYPKSASNVLSGEIADKFYNPLVTLNRVIPDSNFVLCYHSAHFYLVSVLALDGDKVCDITNKNSRASVISKSNSSASVNLFEEN